MAQCLKCTNPLSSVNLENIRIKARPHDWSGVAYVCPVCETVLGIGIDPVSLKTDTVQEILDHLRKD